MNERAPITFDFDRFRAVNLNRCENAFGHKLDSWSLCEWTNAMGGEAGEAANIGKKLLRFRDKVAGNPEGAKYNNYINALCYECADVIIYADLVVARIGAPRLRMDPSSLLNYMSAEPSTAEFTNNIVAVCGRASYSATIGSSASVVLSVYEIVFLCDDLIRRFSADPWKVVTDVFNKKSAQLGSDILL